MYFVPQLYYKDTLHISLYSTAIYIYLYQASKSTKQIGFVTMPAINLLSRI